MRRSAGRGMRALLRIGLCTAAACSGAGVLGTGVACTPSEYRREADQSAYGIIAQARTEAIGREEAFSIETPEQTLRRRLLLDQGLPTASPASYGTREDVYKRQDGQAGGMRG